MNIAIVASECFPFAKMGGLADVIGALPKYLERMGLSVKVFIPKYSSINEKKFGLTLEKHIGEIKLRVAGKSRSVSVYSSTLPQSKVKIYFIDCYEYFHRPNIYTEDPDEDERFILFNKGVIETLQRLKWSPDVIHCNDWQTGLMPLLVKDNYSWDKMFAKTSFLYSIHNIGYQGRFPEETLTKGELRSALYYPGGPLEFNNTVSMMKAGIEFSDVITTVSETYAKEILTPEYGAGLHNVLAQRKDDLFGILNGIDRDEWDPETDPAIHTQYTKESLEKKKENKKSLLEKTEMKYNEKIPLIGIVSRLVAQKGFDLVADALKELAALPVQWIILGTGEKQYEQLFSSMASLRPDLCWTHIGFSHDLAHQIEAGADMFLMPSHYEPCGLNQMYSLRYGTVPIVRKTGGLADTVHDWDESAASGNKDGNGFSFTEPTSTALIDAVTRAVAAFKKQTIWKTIQENGMNSDNSWTNSAEHYLAAYTKAHQHRLPLPG